jgi:hypothetical protein
VAALIDGQLMMYHRRSVLDRLLQRFDVPDV